METADNQAKIDAAADVTDRMVMGAVAKAQASKVYSKEALQGFMDEMFVEIASPFFANRAELREWFEKAMKQSEQRMMEKIARLRAAESA